MALVASSIPHSVRQASFSESSNDLRGGSTYATQNDEFADSRRASRQQVVNRGTYAKAKQAVHVNDDRKNDAVALDMQEK